MTERNITKGREIKYEKQATETQRIFFNKKKLKDEETWRLEGYNSVVIA